MRGNNYAAANWYVAPLLSFADFRALASLPAAELELSCVTPPSGNTVVFRIHNCGKTLAFFTCLRLLDAAGDDLLPACFSDNYLSLLPGESAEVSVSAPALRRATLLEAASASSPPATLALW